MSDDVPEKTKYFLFFYDQSGFDRIQFWQALTDEEVDDLVMGHRSLTDAVLSDGAHEGDMFWLFTERELELMCNDITAELKNETERS